MTKLLWIDMEMTGLDVEKEVIIEVAAIVTNLKLEPLAEYHSVVKQAQKHLDSMDDWNQKHHKESGLVDLVPKGKDLGLVEIELMELMENHFDKKEKIILAGNSIGQDRLFIKKYFKKIEERLHYRMLDVTSFKIVFNNFYSISYAKGESRHRAVDDIKESISELKKYLSFINL